MNSLCIRRPPEIDEDRAPLLGVEDIRGLDIIVDDISAVDELEGVGHMVQHPLRFAVIQRAVGIPSTVAMFCEVARLDMFHVKRQQPYIKVIESGNRRL